MTINCEDAKLTAKNHTMELKLEGVDFYRMYMENDLTELLNEIPLDELKEIVKFRES